MLWLIAVERCHVRQSLLKVMCFFSCLRAVDDKSSWITKNTDNKLLAVAQEFTSCQK